MNGRDSGSAIQQMTTRPMETIAPTFVPGTLIVPKPRVGSRRGALRGASWYVSMGMVSARTPQSTTGRRCGAQVVAGHVGGLRLAEGGEHGGREIAKRAAGIDG